MADQTTERTIRDLVFAGFNRRVLALDRYTGEIVWKWKAPEGTGFVTVMLDGDRLIVSVNGYMYCLDPLFGQVVWNNPLKGLGVGVTSLTSVRGSVNGAEAAAAAAQQQQQAAAAAAAT
jgi:outer membrane protein assembly factor BamB